MHENSNDRLKQTTFHVLIRYMILIRRNLVLELKIKPKYELFLVFFVYPAIAFVVGKSAQVARKCASCLVSPHDVLLDSVFLILSCSLFDKTGDLHAKTYVWVQVLIYVVP